jgi:hypothetical protein
MELVPGGCSIIRAMSPVGTAFTDPDAAKPERKSDEALLHAIRRPQSA